MQNMTPSAVPKTTTSGQIDKAVANYRALLEKHAGQFGSEPVQAVLGQSELADEQFIVFRRRVEMISGLIIRRVKVNRTRPPQEALDATGRRQYTDPAVVNSMPKGEGEEVDVGFFKPEFWEYTRPGYMSDDDLEKALVRRNLVNDPVAVISANEADPTFADEKPHGTHWKDAQGKWCFATFHRWHDEREVIVNRYDNGWHGDWWFAGLRKS